MPFGSFTSGTDSALAGWTMFLDSDGDGVFDTGEPSGLTGAGGSYQFSVQAIWTAVQQQASLVVVVLDNGGYLAVKRSIEGYLKELARSEKK